MMSLRGALSHWPSPLPFRPTWSLPPALLGVAYGHALAFVFSSSAGIALYVMDADRFPRALREIEMEL